jgi:hypothetical protein
MLPVQSRADDPCRHLLEFGIRSALQNNLVNVVPDVEVGIELPGGKTHVERWKDRTLLITRNEIQLRLDELSACLQRDCTLEIARGGDVQWLTFTFDEQKEGVSPRQRINSARL